MSRWEYGIHLGNVYPAGSLSTPQPLEACEPRESLPLLIVVVGGRSFDPLSLRSSIFACGWQLMQSAFLIVGSEISFNKCNYLRRVSAGRADQGTS